MARFKRDAIQQAYQIYVTDALQIIAENTAKQTGGKYIKARFADVYREPIKPTKIDADWLNRGGLEVKNNKSI